MKVRFVLPEGGGVPVGQSVRVVGQVPSLGMWNVGSGRELRRGHDGALVAEVDLPAGELVDFKCVVTGPDGDRWEEGENRSLLVPALGMASTISVAMSLRTNGAPVINEEDAHDRVAKRPSTNGHANGHVAADVAPTPDALSPAPAPVAYDGDDVGAGTDKAWQGKDIVFMRSNEHTGERHGVWNLDGLPPPAHHIVSHDKDAPSWRQKLEAVAGLLAGGPDKTQSDSDLAFAAIYLQWVGTGVIPCVEGGGHHRPCRHAEISLRIFRSLEWALERCGKDNFDAVVIRRIHPYLPSFSEEFTASTPLTRIRDIAHRNDIPSELKQEIKHTIQNKLHRNAGPEDLVATERMLARITAPASGGNGGGGEYPHAFVEEFKRFAVELREFFGASSVETSLDLLRPSFSDDMVAEAEALVASKREWQASGAQASLGQILTLLTKTTKVRGALVGALASGLRNDASEQALSMRQKYRMAEITLEGFAFTLLSQAANGIGAAHNGASGGLHDAVSFLNESLRHMGMGKFMADECDAISNELDLWLRGDEPTERTAVLRLKASLDRGRRLLNAYRDNFLSHYAERASVLGGAMGVPEHNARMFAESETRCHVLFQAAKLSTTALTMARGLLGMSAWDTLVAGTAAGEVVSIDAIDPAALPAGAGPKILLVSRATGDEEVSAAATNVRGVILCQDLPHLSHLGIRARQEGIVFVTCTNDAEIATARALTGQAATLVATEDGVQITPGADGAEGAGGGAGGGAGDTSPVADGDVAAAAAAAGACEIDKVDMLTTIGLRGAEARLCGAKAALCGELGTEEAKGGLAFGAPDGVCLPFGSMEVCVGLNGPTAEKEISHTLAVLETTKGNSKSLERRCGFMQTLITDMIVPKTFLRGVASHFGAGSRVAVRSSANVEDLKGMSAAGLYESVLNVPADDLDRLEAAIKIVWASLYSRRAVLSRKSAGVAEADACMAVLIQDMVDSEYSFVLNTEDPITNDANFLYAEVALGLGETLASGAQGSPWRLRINKRDAGDVEILAFANFSQQAETHDGAAVDYSRLKFTEDPEALRALGSRLAQIGCGLEAYFGEPQDIEGALVGDDDVYIVQSRPMK